MATVHCPQCHRALTLPEGQEIEVVCCPLCRHTFTPPAVPRIIQAPLPQPTERIHPRWPLEDGGELPPLRSLEPIEDEDYVPVRRRGEEQRAMESAAAWMRTMAWIGMSGTLPCCGITGLMMQDPGKGQTTFFVFLCVLVAAFASILAGARAFQQQSSFGLAVTGVVLTLLTTSGLTLLCLPVVLKMMDLWPGAVPILDSNCCGVLLVFPGAVVIVCGMVGGIKGLIILLRPGTRELFQTRGE